MIFPNKLTFLATAIFLSLIPSEQNYLQFRTQLPYKISQRDCLSLPEHRVSIIVCPQENIRCIEFHPFRVKCINEGIRLTNGYQCEDNFLDFGIIAKIDSKESVTIQANFVPNKIRDRDVPFLKIEPSFEETCKATQELTLKKDQVYSFFLQKPNL